MKYQKLFVTVILIATSLINSCGGRKFQVICGISEVSQIGINHLQPLVDAMEQYKKDNGRYPKYGTDLIPEYINKVPVIASEGENFDQTTINVLRDERLRGDKATFEEDGSYFSLEFYPKDNRICLMGRNNICEYKSDTKKWGCYQH